MKKSEIQIGKTYHNGKGKQRKVLSFHKFSLDYDPDVKYEFVGGAWQGHTTGKMWLPYFASWAKGVVDETTS